MSGTAVTVESVREVGPGTVALELRTPDGFDALPGQFVLIRAAPGGEDGAGVRDGAGADGETEDAGEAAEEVARHYTLSSPGVTDTFELTIGVDPEGDLSPWLADRRPGDEIRVEGPFGNVTYERDRDVVAVAGGPGVGPAVSIAEAAHEAGHDAVVVYQDDEPAHVERLDDLEAAGAAVTIVDGDDDAGLADAIAAHLEDGQFYAFGFSDFVRTVVGAIEDAGGDPDEAQIENFG